MQNIDELIEKSDLYDMLEFETQVFLDVVHNDGLIVAAKGLLLDHVLLNIFKVYNDPGNLVIVLNSLEAEEKYYIEKLNSELVHSVTASTSIPDREDLYLSGGIHFVTTRILSVDMLKKRIPIDKITGIIVLRAHQVLESCQEAFVLRLYRQHNKTGFIKAFTNNPQSFTVGFGHIERVMRTLFIKELYLLPRFHSLVIQSLKKHEPQVIELHIPISQGMSKIQTCILDLMNLTVKELKRINKTLELEEITVENCLTKEFHKILQNQLDCVWHQLSSKSRQLIADLKTLRHLIVTLLYTDPVTFYSILSGYRTKEYAQTAMWVLLEPADLLFTSAKQLIFNENNELNPEFCPKWKALSEILKVEIPEELKKQNSMDNNVLILCQDMRTCFQLNQFLTTGAHQYLFYMTIKKGIQFKTINKDFKGCGNVPKVSISDDKQVKRKSTSSKTAKKTKVDVKKQENTDGNSSKTKDDDEEEDDELENLKSSYLLSMSQSVCNKNDETEESGDSTEYVFEPISEIDNMNLSQLCDITKSNPNPTVLIQTFKSTDRSSLYQTLEEINPRFIIMYHSDMSAIRQIELYEAHRKKDRQLKVYFLVHAGTVEEQSYLTSLCREKQAFEYLIETKSTMVIPEDQDGKSDECLALQRGCAIPEKNTRKGGVLENKETRKLIVVDMREFRSELPALIHKRGIDIEPLTITIGDYILTPEICVERKTLSDLISSLNSGRLYQQCTQMTRYYAKPMLLIEFDQNKPFSWQSNYMISSDSNNFEVQQKLLLLTLHFPKLKIIWSPSPYASAQLFEELKDGKEEPNIAYATAIGSEQDLDTIETKYNSNIYDFVQKLPGITSKNIDAFLRRAKNMNTAIKMGLQELKDILGNTNDAQAFYSALHEEHAPKENETGVKQKSRIQNKFKYMKNKK